MGIRRAKIADIQNRGVRRHGEIIRLLEKEHGIETSPATLTRDLKALDEDYRESAKSAIEKERGVSLMRAEAMIRRLNDKLERIDTARRRAEDGEEGAKNYEIESDLPTIRLLKEWEERRSKLLGLDMPTKIAQTDPTGEKEYTGGIPQSFKDRHLSPARDQEEIVVEAEHEPVKEIEG